MFPPLTLAATVLVVVALYSKGMDAPRRWRLGLVGAGLAVLAGVGLVLSDPGAVGIAAVLISAVSAAIAGWVGGAGATRGPAGTDDPAGLLHTAPEPRSSRQKPR